MPVTYPRKDCAFCQYYDAKHNVDRCHCAACWRRRTQQAAAAAAAPAKDKGSLSNQQSTPPPHAATTKAAQPAVDTGAARNSRCTHSAVPFHQCKQCVLPPYFQRKPTQWDGHAIVCAPQYFRRDGCGCGPRCAGRQHRSDAHRHGCGDLGAQESAAVSRPQYTTHEVPQMGPRAALYIKS